MLPRQVVETIYPWSSRAHQTRTGVWKPMTHTSRPTALQGRQGNNSRAHSIYLMNRPVPKLTEGTPSPCTCHEEVHCPWRAAQSSLHSFRPAGAKERRTHWGHGQGQLSPAFPSPAYSQQMFTKDTTASHYTRFSGTRLQEHLGLSEDPGQVSAPGPFSTCVPQQSAAITAITTCNSPVYPAGEKKLDSSLPELKCSFRTLLK